MRVWVRSLATCAIALPAAAEAHVSDATGGVISGMLHPVLGIDHLLAMVLVGVISTRGAPSDVWKVPMLFLVAAAAGTGAGVLAGAVPSLIEAGVAASVVALGIAACNPALAPGMGWVRPAVGLFGGLHGLAHGGELQSVQQPAAYTAGFLLTTGSLHLAGVVLGEFNRSGWRGAVLRSSALSGAVLGLVLLVNRWS